MEKSAEVEGNYSGLNLVAGVKRLEVNTVVLIR